MDPGRGLLKVRFDPESYVAEAHHQVGYGSFAEVSRFTNVRSCLRADLAPAGGGIDTALCPPVVKATVLR